MKKADYLKALIEGGKLPEGTNINDFKLDELKEEYDQMVLKETKDETENPIQEPVIVKPEEVDGGGIEELIVDPVSNVGFKVHPWRLLCKSYSEEEGNTFEKTTRALQLSENHILIQVTTVDDKSSAVALTTIPGRLTQSIENDKIYVIG